ncbi:MAG TPA: potassium/proton antiporter [Spirochaetales bacterium]|nr:potassium/proton antiporter [Spirochaetales bacterium]
MLLLFASLLIAAVFSTKISAKLGMPVLIAFIGIGLLVGSDVLNLIYFDDAALTKRIADILLIFILFVGGFKTQRASLKTVAGPALTLATLGVALTAVFLGLIIHLLTKQSLATCFMIASIISSTDAAAVMMITRGNPLADRVASTLEVESASNDPAAILLTIAFVDLVSQGQSSGGKIQVVPLIGSLAWQFLGGLGIGFVVSKLAAILFDKLESEDRGYYHVLIIGVILLAYGGADLIGANGIIAVFFMGYWLGNTDFVGKRGVSNFLDGIASFSNIALFLMLGLLAFPHNFAHVWKEGLSIAALLIFVVRPAVVFLCVSPFRYTFREKLFIAWGGIKGAVPIVLATYPAAYGLDPDGTIFNIIFFAVLISCVVQGTTMAPIAKALRLTVPLKPRSPHTLELNSVRKTNIDMFEMQIDANSPAANKRIRDLDLPDDVLISSIVRNGKIIAPRGTSMILPDDILFVLGPRQSMDLVAAMLTGSGGIVGSGGSGGGSSSGRIAGIDQTNLGVTETSSTDTLSNIDTQYGSDMLSNRQNDKGSQK